jgi:O-antigen/teichoic acid export membrane protein
VISDTLAPVATTSWPPSPTCALRRTLAKGRHDSLVRNAGALMASSAITAALGYAYWALAARALPAAEVGRGASLVSALTVTSLLVCLGWSATLVSHLARHHDDADAWSAAFWGVALTAVVASVAAGALAWWLLSWTAPSVSSAASLPLAAVFVVGVAATSASTVLDAAFIACRSSGRVVIRAGVASAVKLPLLALALWGASQRGATALFASWVVAIAGSTALGALVLLPRLRPGLRLRLGQPLALVRGLGGAFLLNQGASLAGQLPAYLLPLLVTVRLSPADTGYFYVTWMTGSAFFMVSPAVSSALLAEGAHDRARLASAARRAAAVTFAVLIPMAATMLLAGGWVLARFGPEYSRHGKVLLAALVVSALPDAITNIAVARLRVDGRLGAAAALNLSMAGATFIGSWLLLPVFGISGAGLAWLGAQSAGALVVVAIALHGRRRPSVAAIALR